MLSSPTPPVHWCCNRFWAKDWWHLVTSFYLDCQHCLLRETEGISNQDTFRSYSHKRIFSLIPAVKALFLSDPHDCSTVTKFLATCKMPSLPLWDKKEHLSLFDGRGLRFCKAAVTAGRVCTAQSGHFGLVKHHSHNHCKRGCRTAVGHRFRNPPSVFPGFGKFFNEAVIWNTWVIRMGQLLHMQISWISFKVVCLWKNDPSIDAK